MDKFQEMRAFAAVVDAGSFVKAADALASSTPVISRLVAELEARLGLRLMHRTTRKLSLTEEGEVFHARCKDLLAAVDEAEAEVTSRTGTAAGLVRINAPLSFGILHLADLWGDFMTRHPKVTLDVTLSDRVVDLVEEGYDLAIRIARLPNSSLITRKLATTRMVMCASPQYLKRAGVPRRPSELADHSVLAYSYWATRDEWQFDGPSGKVTVRTRPSIRSNNGETCRAGALQHRGIVLQPSFMVGADLRSGTLVELMPEYRSIELDISAVYPTRKHVSPKVRLLIDFLVESFRTPRWLD
ncbi:LysR substrate-binding domain-containing protein [Methylibium sp.]|uniref:LysR family transcriptional regulator n=1 Tax=Methylibium sp. TaxID=2067992 RepID=UPI003D0FECE2